MTQTGTMKSKKKRRDKRFPWSTEPGFRIPGFQDFWFLLNRSSGSKTFPPEECSGNRTKENWKSWNFHDFTIPTHFQKKVCILMFSGDIFLFHQGLISVFTTCSKSSVLLYVFNRFWSDFLPGIVSGKSFFREGCLFPDDRSRQILGSWNSGIRNPDSDDQMCPECVQYV